jgi:predicted SAM-dependent methyltransferase
MSGPLKIHLGCGERYLDGYVNIDFPPSEHTVQRKSVADRYCDILSLKYSVGSAVEVRLHHVFEHFQRPEACALLAGWHSWLSPGGLLRIEVPDFQRSALHVLNPFGRARSKAVSLRHLFGSHEEAWAVHCEGYTPESLSDMVSRFGFTVKRVERSRWKDTRNFEVLAVKKNVRLSPEESASAAETYLSRFLVDGSEGEKRLLGVWMERFRKRIRMVIAGEGVDP